MTAKITLNTTRKHGERFAQKWTIVDETGKTYKVTSDSEWGDVAIKSGGAPVIEIAGTRVNIGQIVGCAISCGCGPTENGEECPLDAKWVKDVVASGADINCLAEPV